MLMRRYKHVIVLGLDGIGPYFRVADTPNFDRIFEKGAITHKALSSRPTISAECWASMLLGVGPEIHKLTNSTLRSTPYPVDSRFPSVFRRIREVYPDAKLGSYCDWNPITYGVVENNLGVSTATARDEKLTPMICNYIYENRPDFLFIQFDSVDHAGHSKGYGSPEYMQRIHEVDGLMNDIYQAVADAGMMEDTLFMMIGDHGGTNRPDGSGTHGGWSDTERLVPFAAVGKGIKQGQIGDMNIRDLASIILYAFGIEAPELDDMGWTSQIPHGLFENADIPQYREVPNMGTAPRISEEPHTSRLI